jgi:hypothetical protein
VGIHRYVVGAALAATLTATPLLAGGNANFALGVRTLGDDMWEAIDVQPVSGVTVDFGRATWPISLAIGYHVSTREEEDQEVAGLRGDFRGVVGDLSFGVRKTWRTSGGARVYVEGGASTVIADMRLEDATGEIEDNDTSLGGYAQAGIFWRTGPRFNIGASARAVVGTDVTLNDFAQFGDGDADYVQVALSLGWGWPAE